MKLLSHIQVKILYKIKAESSQISDCERVLLGTIVYHKEAN